MIRLHDIDPNTTTEVEPGSGKWVVARPLPFFSVWHRLRDAWLVLTGKCDAFQWPQNHYDELKRKGQEP